MTKINELVRQYRGYREELDAKRKEFTTLENKNKLLMFELEQKMLEISNDLGVNSFKTDHGTVFKTIKTYARLGEGEDSKMLREKYAISTGDFGLFTSHVNKTHAKELKDEGIDLSKTGVDWIEEYTMQFRK